MGSTGRKIDNFLRLTLRLKIARRVFVADDAVGVSDVKVPALKGQAHRVLDAGCSGRQRNVGCAWDSNRRIIWLGHLSRLWRTIPTAATAAALTRRLRIAAVRCRSIRID